MTKKLLIIDDNSTQLNILKVLFTNENWEVRGVQNALIGYEMIFDFAPDLIITDAVMPLMGGFKLIKLIRENEKISKIPVIVYSILGESNSKFYMKEEYNEYFLQKDDNHAELIELANNLTQRFPLDEQYQNEIIKTGLERYKNAEQNQTSTETSTEEITLEENEIQVNNFDILKEKIKEKNDFSNPDEKIFSEIFSILHEKLNYDLAVISVYSFENEDKKLYFDIRDIILSPILKNTLLNKFEAKIHASQKKYAPNLTTVVNESEFISKIELNFEYKNETIANIAFYSKEKLNWEENNTQETLKETLFEFFKKRYIQKTTQAIKKEHLPNKYSSQNNKFEEMKNTQNVFFATLQITNYSDFATNLTNQELDTLNSKLSEKIISCIENNEQIYKNDEDEYNLIFYAKNEKHARYRLEYIVKTIEETNFDVQINLFAVGVNCTIDDNFNIIEAQKIARNLLDEATYLEKVVIYNEQ